MRRSPEKRSSEALHIPVLLDEVVDIIGGCPEGVVLDGTVGAGGHLKAIYGAYGEKYQYYGFDLDNEILNKTRTLFSECGYEAEFINANYKKIVWYLQRRGIKSISAFLLDLGIGSFQIDNPSRGFSYLQDGPLSMAFDGSDSLAASKMIDSFSEKELRDVLYEYGEEPKARAIARAIKDYPETIDTTERLASVIQSVVGERNFIKTAARVFQALRIKVNSEFHNLEEGLDKLLPKVAPGGRALIITYHSLEDHLVKRMVKKFTGKCICPPRLPECRCGKEKLFKVITSKPILPSRDEIRNNPRARSAKLRVVERLAQT